MENKSNKLLTERFQKLAGLTAINEYNPARRDKSTFEEYVNKLTDAMNETFVGIGATDGYFFYGDITGAPRMYNSDRSVGYDGYQVKIYFTHADITEPKLIGELKVFFDYNNNEANNYFYYSDVNMREVIIGTRDDQMKNFITDEEMLEQSYAIGDYMGKQVSGVDATVTDIESTDDSDKIYEPEYNPFCKRNLKDGWYDANIVTGKSFFRLGDCGDAVEIAQEFVNELIYKVFDDLDILEVDGMYGTSTINAVKNVQSKVGTRADGKYGKATHEAISKFLAAKPKIDQLPANQKTELERTPIKLGDLVPIAPAEERDTGQHLLDKIKANKQTRVQRRINRLNKKKAKLTRPKQF
jgi:hypothetical protein